MDDLRRPVRDGSSVILDFGTFSESMGRLGLAYVERLSRTDSRAFVKSWRAALLRPPEFRHTSVSKVQIWQDVYCYGGEVAVILYGNTAGATGLGDRKGELSVYRFRSESFVSFQEFEGMVRKIGPLVLADFELSWSAYCLDEDEPVRVRIL